jgi:hypothetical protein
MESDPESDPELDPDPLVRGTDPRIRIRTKMSQIPNNAFYDSSFQEYKSPKERCVVSQFGYQGKEKVSDLFLEWMYLMFCL